MKIKFCNTAFCAEYMPFLTDFRKRGKERERWREKNIYVKMKY